MMPSPPTYSIWTIGCQMNKAESNQITNYMQQAGYTHIPTFKKADVVILNSCVVRQNAEDKVVGMLSYLKGIKKLNPDLVVIVTGCFVDSNLEKLENDYPYVNLFFKPGDFDRLLKWRGKSNTSAVSERKDSITAPENSCSVMIPIIEGCNNFCTYCIVPFRRGQERSRSLASILQEVQKHVNNGVKEIILLGQNVNSYGHDLPEHPELSLLLSELNSIDNLLRIRFLTNHPKDMNVELIEAIAKLSKVCKHLNLPIQSGDDDILNAMGRHYSVARYMNLVKSIRKIIPDIGLSTDIIVGFPGETDSKFENTVRIIEEIKFDTVHIATYSPRSGTIAAANYKDIISPEIKRQRLQKIENKQSIIAADINNSLLGYTVDVLVEGKKKNKWFGRTESDKLVFFESEIPLFSNIVKITINKASSWSLQGKLQNN